MLASRRPFVMLLSGVVLLLVATGAYLWVLGGTNPLGGQVIDGNVTLVEANGHTTTDRSLRGRWLLLYFGYTQCRDICPTTLRTIGPALQAMGPQGARVQPVFITVDPTHDTPQVVRDYSANFMPRLIGLTGSARALQRVRREFHVQAIRHPGEIAHSSALLLVGPDGRVVAPLAADQTAADLAAAIGARMI